MDGERERLNQRISELTDQLHAAKTTIQSLETINVRVWFYFYNKYCLYLHAICPASTWYLYLCRCSSHIGLFDSEIFGKKSSISISGSGIDSGIDSSMFIIITIYFLFMLARAELKTFNRGQQNKPVLPFLCTRHLEQIRVWASMSVLYVLGAKL